MSLPLIDSSQKPVTTESVLEELTRSGSDVSVIVNTPNWNAIPLLIRDWDRKEETTKMRLLDEMSRILTLASDLEVPMANKRLLHSTLSTLSQTPTLSKKVRLRITQALVALDSVPDGPFLLVETAEFRGMEQSHSELTKRINHLQKELEESKRKAEEKTTRELEEAREEMANSEREKREMSEKMELMKLQLVNLPIWIGTESLQTLDRTVHRLTPTTLTPSIKFERSNKWRTAFTHPIDEGEWELMIRRSKQTGLALGFVRHPLPEDATHNNCGSNADGIGGDFVIWDGKMWKNGEFKPEGTNKKCDRIGQTAAIRVNIRKREARLFIDDEEQPGIFTGIPSPLCLGISTSSPLSLSGSRAILLTMCSLLPIFSVLILKLILQRMSSLCMQIIAHITPAIIHCPPQR
ncbi:hypothetical protein BLNAU_14059 [Blattamonas nauphoetae]|uniref:Uncharacterized protein n=1 Tax=Blattamonas nauphoetae TaxID=2049346 RepID=A0ABQ9XL49_9EUKA|nr:hypothetical protein BLNAU_14059 [Blattamonas nauphoetae]